LKEEMTDNVKKESDHISRLESNLAVIKSRANSRLEKASDVINQLTERSEKYSNKISELQDTLQNQSETIVNMDLRLEGETDTVKKLKSEIERQEDEHHQEIQKFISSVNQVKSQFCFLIKGFINIISIIVCYLAPSISI
jgi:archaellum component FlaC